MLLDIYNSTALNPGFLGDGLTRQVEDSFDLYPGRYEGRWSVDKTAMLEKIRALSQYEAAWIEIWAVALGSIQEGVEDAFEKYITGKLSLGSALLDYLQTLQDAAKKLEESRSVAKIQLVSEARAEIERVIGRLAG
jgi:hypothetical protein